MNLADRSGWTLVRAPFQRKHWLALGRMVSVFSDPVSALRRYLSTGGSYPWSPRLRTPTGTVQPTLHSFHDVRTVNEVFCRHDYGDGDGAEVVVDLGANIGISALFFLSRNAACRVHCYEPDPKNVERLRRNLSAHASRAVIHPAAVTPAGGPVTFVAEPSGRYGHVDRGSVDAPRPNESRLEVDSVAIGDALRSVLEAEGHIDVVKIDTEGNEPDLVAAIPEDVLGRLGHVYYEDNQGGVVHLTPGR